MAEVATAAVGAAAAEAAVRAFFSCFFLVWVSLFAAVAEATAAAVVSVGPGALSVGGLREARWAMALLEVASMVAVWELMRVRRDAAR